VAITRTGFALTQVTTAATGWTPTIPATASVGDFAIMFMENESSPNMTTPPGNGWTARGAKVADATTDVSTFVFYKFLTGTDGPGFTLSSAQRGQVIIATYSGVDTTTPWDTTTAHESEASGTSWTTTSIVPVTNGAMIVAFIAVDAAAGQTQPYFATATSPLTVVSSTEDATALTELGFADGVLATAGSQGAVWTTGGTADVAVSWLSALRPAVTAAATLPPRARMLRGQSRRPSGAVFA
jgi:hypothetical protein